VQLTSNRIAVQLTQNKYRLNFVLIHQSD